MAVALVGAAGGCSLGGDEEPKPASGTARQIGETVTQLERAVAGRDWAGVCRDVFTAAARKRAGGGGCAKALAMSAEGVRRPRIEVREIEVRGDEARVEVSTMAAGQARVADVLELRREGGEWRVEALAG
jgi:hypothetical protein